MRIVLAVEDDLQEQLAISRAVRTVESVKLVIADTGGDAIDYINRRGPHEWRRRSEDPCLVIADHNLPDMLAIDLVKGVRDNPATRDTPVFVYAESLNGEAEVYAQYSVDGPCTKPATEQAFRTTLIEAVRRHLGAE